MPRGARTAGAVALLTGMVGCTAPDEGPRRAPIIQGATDPGDPGIVLLIRRDASGGSLCTAEVISPHVVLTAAHCVDPAIVGAASRYEVGIGPTLAGATTVRVTETHPHPEFSLARIREGNDVAVAITETALAIPPVPFRSAPVTAAAEGRPLRLVGFGITDGTDTTGRTAGTRRVGLTTLAAVDPLYLRVDGRPNTCEGDSGGPALMAVEDGGPEEIVGLTSFGDMRCSLTTVLTRVDRHAAYIQAFVAEHDPPPDPPTMMSGGCSFCGAGTPAAPWAALLACAGVRLLAHPTRRSSG